MCKKKIRRNLSPNPCTAPASALAPPRAADTWLTPSPGARRDFWDGGAGTPEPRVAEASARRRRPRRAPRAPATKERRGTRARAVRG